MMYMDRPGNFYLMDGHSNSRRPVYNQEFDIKCIIELDDDESIGHKKSKQPSPTRTECPAMKERLARHMLQCSSRSNKGSRKGNSKTGSKFSTGSQTAQLNIKCNLASRKARNKEILTDFNEKTLVLSPIISMDATYCNLNNQTRHNKSTPEVEKYLKSNKQSIEELFLRRNCHSTEDKKEEINDKKLKQTDTIILHSQGHYKDNLQTIIRQWLLEIPVFPYIDQASKIIRDNAVNDLNEAIFNLTVDINNENYQENVKKCIHDFMNNLPIWYPCSVKDHEGYKKDLANNLSERVKILNTDLSSVNNNNKNHKGNCTHGREANDLATEIDTKIEKSIVNYLSNLKFVETDDWGQPINMNRVKDEIVHRLKPIMRIMSQYGKNKLYLKTELMSILREIPLAWNNKKDKQLDIFSGELSDIILAAQTNKQFDVFTNSQNQESEVFNHQDSDEKNVNKYKIMQDIIQLINSVIDTNNNSQKQELFDMFLDSFNSIRSGNENYAEDALYEFLNRSYDISEHNASVLTKKIMQKIKSVKKSPIDKSCSPIFLPRDRLTKSILVFVSDHDLSGPGPSVFPTTSTPKKASLKKGEAKLNAEETMYLEELTKLINTWIDTVPELVHVNNDKNYKEVMVSDLAGHLMDEMKLEQYGLDQNYLGTRYNLFKFIVSSWIIKFEEHAFQNIAEDQEKIEKYLDNFYMKFSEISVPVLTKPHHGNRQIQKNLKFRQIQSNESAEFIPEGIDTLEDEISIWMNEQPSHIYVKQNDDMRNEMLHDFALKLQDQLKSNKSSEEIKIKTKQWLDKMLKPNEKNNIDILAEVLKERIMKVPLDETLIANQERMIRLKNEDVNKSTKEYTNDNITKYNLNKTLLDFIDKFIEHNYEEDDMLVKGAFSELFKSEFRRLSPLEKNEMYKNWGKENRSKEILSDRLTRELHYIKDISDWLKTMPIEKSFNVPGNSDRIEFVISLAKHICDIETERIQSPKAMSYNDYIRSLIFTDLQYLPFLPNKLPTHQNLLDIELKIYNSRKVLDKNANLNVSDGSDKPVSIDEFVDGYIRINGNEIANDPAKLEVWKARIKQEIDNMFQSAKPVTSIEQRLDNVPKPGDESVAEFNRKLCYAHEIGDWIKNMPLQAITDEETTNMITKMISNLADELSRKHTSNIQNDPEVREFVMNWILTLPLEPTKEVDVSLLIEQLANRIKRVNEGKYQSLNDSSIADNKSISETKKHNIPAGNTKVGCSGELIVNAIENWCKKLPIKEQDENNENKIKDSIAIKLFQKVSDLNLDPRFNDDILYQDFLGDEIDKLFEDLKRHNEVQKNKEKLKSNLITAIVEARSIIKEQTAGEQYKQKLENRLEASIPAPVTHKKIFDPGFEIYKNKLTNMFILENFDHGDDNVKLKYEVKIKDAIDKCFQEAQKRNAIPLCSDEIYNDLYAALFAVPIPNETSVIQEVEEVKLRCEIDAWFEGLPLREAINLNEQLEWDNILAMLAKRIYEIESNNPQAEDKIHKEITKWLVNFPLLPGEERNIEKHAKALENRLKSSKNDRKCIPRSQMDKVAKKGKSLKKMTGTKNVSLSRSQTAGPSRANQTLSSPQPCCVAASTPRKKPGDLLLEIIENWCFSLPLSRIESGNDITIRDNLATEIFKKLSELNTDPRVFEDDMLYNKNLADELERLIRTLPMCCELQQSKDVRKQALISAIQSIKPLVRQERAGLNYKKEIKNTIKEMLPEPLDKTAEKVALFNNLVDEIADSFIEYNYNRDDYEGKQKYKNQIREAIITYFEEINNQSNEDPLLKQNKLICELIKVPIPGEIAMKEEVEGIKMKEEVSNFLDDIIPGESNAVVAQKEHIKKNLSKRLHDLEKSGHSCATDKTMKEEIVKCLKKANQDVDINKVEEFVSQLKDDEAIRKSPPIRKPDKFQSSVNVSKELKQHGYAGFGSMIEQPYDHQDKYESEKFYTLPPASHLYSGLPPDISVISQAKVLQPGKSYTYQSSGQYLQPPKNGSVIHYPHDKDPYSYHTIPEIPGLQPPSSMFNSYNNPKSVVNNSGQSSKPQPDQPRSMIFNSGQTCDSPRPGVSFDTRFPQRQQTRRHSLDLPTSQSTHGPRRQSLQIPLKYENNLYDKKSPPNYRDVCVEQPQTNIHMPLPVLTFNDAPNLSRPIIPSRLPRLTSPTQNRSTVTSPRPMSPTARPLWPQNTSSTQDQPQYSSLNPPGYPVQMLRPPQPTSPRSTPAQIQPSSSANAAYPDQNQSQSTPLVSLFQESSVPQQSPNTLPPPSNLTASRPMTTQSYQGFQNAVAAVSSPFQPQATAPISQDVADQGTDAPIEGTHRMAEIPNTLYNPPRKRRRIRSNEEEDMCECLGKDMRCSPFPPILCYMPFRYPSFCFY